MQKFVSGGVDSDTHLGKNQTATIGILRPDGDKGLRPSPAREIAERAVPTFDSSGDSAKSQVWRSIQPSSASRCNSDPLTSSSGSDGAGRASLMSTSQTVKLCPKKVERTEFQDSETLVKVPGSDCDLSKGYTVPEGAEVAAIGAGSLPDSPSGLGQEQGSENSAGVFSLPCTCRCGARRGQIPFRMYCKCCNGHFCPVHFPEVNNG